MFSIEEDMVLKTTGTLPPKVVQKDPVEDFIEGLPTTTIYIDGAVIGQNVESLKAAEFEKGELFESVAGFEYGEDIHGLGISGYGDYENEISFNFSKYPLTKTNSIVEEYTYSYEPYSRNVFTKQFEGVFKENKIQEL